ncbi:hypothetical protein ACS0TY_006308 [Phlomoides rotata]
MAPKMFKSKVPMFSVEDYDDCKIRMQTHLSAMNDEMWSIIEDVPIVIEKPNTSNDQTTETVQVIPNPKKEWTDEDKRRVNLDNVAKNTIYHTLDKIVFSKIKQCKTTKEIWEKLEMICEGTDQIKENKLMIDVQKFENFKMKSGESLEKFDLRYTEILNEMESLGKDYSLKEKNLKVLRALPTECDMKMVAMRESNDQSKTSTFELFYDLKAFEFDIDRRNDEETPSSKVIALVASTTESNQAVDSDSEQDELALFIKNPGHFTKYCPYPESKRYTDEESASRAEKKRKQEKERIRALLSEFENTKEASPSSSKLHVESDSEDSIDSEDNEALICLMAKEEEILPMKWYILYYYSSEFENTKEASPSSSKLHVESDSEDSIDSEDNEALICLMAKEEEVNSSDSVLNKDSPNEMVHSLLLLMEDVKAIKSDNEALKEENLLIKRSESVHLF